MDIAALVIQRMQLYERLSNLEYKLGERRWHRRVARPKSRDVATSESKVRSATA